MEKNKTCSFFGHRKVKVTDELTEKVKSTVEDLILNHNVSNFLFGSRSEFDRLCHYVVTLLKEKYPFIKRVAYTCKSETCVLENEREKVEAMYSRVFKKEVHLLGVEEEHEYKTKYVSGKASYVERNQAMIDDSGYCIFYCDEYYVPPKKANHNKMLGEYTNSGTIVAFKYATRKKKYILNMFDPNDGINENKEIL